MEALEIFSKRLKNARTMKGFSMDDLVSAMGGVVSKTAIMKYEKCQIGPSSTVLIALSSALDQPVDYFFRPFSIQVESIKFRKTRTRLGAKEEKSIRENITDLFERYIAIEEICNEKIPFHSPLMSPISTDEDAKASAKKIRQEWNLGESGIINAIDLAEGHGVKVLEITAPASFDGLSTMVNESHPIIVLNHAACPERKRFTLLHELGHLLMSFSPSVTSKDEENLCSLFAGEMLIPESVIKRELGDHRKDISYQELKTLQRKFGISCEALMHKARQCDIISAQKLREFFIQKNSQHWFKSLVESSLYPEETSLRFKTLVFKALSCELITLSKASVLLHQDVEIVRKELALVW